jgi:hypothetical protein
VNTTAYYITICKNFIFQIVSLTNVRYSFLFRNTEITTEFVTFAIGDLKYMFTMLTNMSALPSKSCQTQMWKRIAFSTCCSNKKMIVLVTGCLNVKIYHYTKCQGPTLDGARVSAHLISSHEYLFMCWKLMDRHKFLHLLPSLKCNMINCCSSSWHSARNSANETSICWQE